MAFSFCPQTDPINGQRGIDKVHEPGDGDGGGGTWKGGSLQEQTGGIYKEDKTTTCNIQDTELNSRSRDKIKADRRSME